MPADPGLYRNGRADDATRAAARRPVPGGEFAAALGLAWDCYFANWRLGHQCRDLFARAAGLGRDRALCFWVDLSGAERLALLQCVPALLAVAECLSRELARPADEPARLR